MDVQDLRFWEWKEPEEFEIKKEHSKYDFLRHTWNASIKFLLFKEWIHQRVLYKIKHAAVGPLLRVILEGMAKGMLWHFNPIHSCAYFINCEHVPLPSIILIQQWWQRLISPENNTQLKCSDYVCCMLVLSPKDKERSLYTHWLCNKYTFRFKFISVPYLEYIILLFFTFWMYCMCFSKRTRSAWHHIMTIAVSIEILHAQSLVWPRLGGSSTVLRFPREIFHLHL